MASAVSGCLRAACRPFRPKACRSGRALALAESPTMSDFGPLPVYSRSTFVRWLLPGEVRPVVLFSADTRVPLIPRLIDPLRPSRSSPTPALSIGHGWLNHAGSLSIGVSDFSALADWPAGTEHSACSMPSAGPQTAL